MSKFLNVGCGNRFFSDWVNIDFISTHPSVQCGDLLSGINYEDNSFKVVYHSHVLEHFNKEEGFKFLSECYRVLNPGGIIRVVVPDLEQIAKLYINKLNLVITDPNPLNKANYLWAYLELFDQTTRKAPGGEILKYWSNDKIDNYDYVVNRVGFEFLNFRNQILNREKVASVNSNDNLIFSFFQRSLSFFKRRLNILLNGSDFNEKFELGNFIKSGEIHLMMYDRYSLSELLYKIGFVDIKIVDAHTSDIPNWDYFKWLDVEGSNIRKPDSLFIEATKGE